MRTRNCVSFAALMPLMFGLNESDADSEHGKFTFAFGGGSYEYISGGCEGVPRKEKVDYTDFGAEYQRNVRDNLALGVRVGVLFDPRPQGIFEDRILYINPYLAAESHWYGLGIGPILASGPISLGRESTGTPRFSGHLRIGHPHAHLRASLFESVPLYSGGALRVGPYVDIHDRFNLGIGYAAIPYENAGVFVHADLRVTRNWSLLVRTTFSDASEYGWAVGTTIRFSAP